VAFAEWVEVQRRDMIRPGIARTVRAALGKLKTIGRYLSLALRRQVELERNRRAMADELRRRLGDRAHLSKSATRRDSIGRLVEELIAHRLSLHAACGVVAGILGENTEAIRRQYQRLPK
jgi:hypothetical protein